LLLKRCTALALHRDFDVAVRRSPAAAAGETLNSDSRNAAAVRCNGWFELRLLAAAY